VWTDLGLISLDDAIEGGGLHVSLFNEDSLQGSYPEVHLRDLRTMIVVVVVVVIMYGHARNLRDRQRFAYVNGWMEIGTRGPMPAAQGLPAYVPQPEAAPHSRVQVSSPFGARDPEEAASLASDVAKPTPQEARLGVARQGCCIRAAVPACGLTSTAVLRRSERQDPLLNSQRARCVRYAGQSGAAAVHKAGSQRSPTRLVALAKGYGMVRKLWVQRSMMGHRLQPT
jgi:hypothetical protein